MMIERKAAASGRKRCRRLKPLGFMGRPLRTKNLLPKLRHEPSARRSGGQLFRQNVDGADFGQPVEQLFGVTKERGGDRALKRRLPSRVAAEAVKDSKCPLVDPEREPGDRSRLLGD